MLLVWDVSVLFITYNRSDLLKITYESIKNGLYFEDLCVEFVVADEIADEAIDTILKAAATGEIGDGKVFVSEVEQAIRIRTGERGELAV